MTSNTKVYLHELIDIVGQQRARYMHHMTAHWCPKSRVMRDQLLFGVWGTFGSTGRWPEVVNLWEYPNWDAMAAAFDLEVDAPALQDPVLQEWWARAASLRRGGFDRLLAAAPWTRSIEELVADGVRGHVYAHEIVRLPHGTAPAFLDQVRDVGRPCLEALGITLVGAFLVAMRSNNECILLWAFPDMATWASFEDAWLRSGPAVAPWLAALQAADADVQRMLLVDSPLNPMKNGRQPVEEDQIPLEDFFPPMT